jgi:hypothetical protein
LVKLHQAEQQDDFEECERIINEIDETPSTAQEAIEMKVSMCDSRFTLHVNRVHIVPFLSFLFNFKLSHIVIKIRYIFIFIYI